MTYAQLFKIKRRAARATEGPWRFYNQPLRRQISNRRIIEVQCNDWEGGPVVQWSGFDDSDRTMKQHCANAMFIAHARRDIPDLVAEVERLQAMIDHRRARGKPGVDS